MLTARVVRCPQCLSVMPWNRAKAATGSFCCPHCSAFLEISKTYIRALGVPCIAAGFALTWEPHVWAFLSQSLGCPMAIAAPCMGLVAAFPMFIILVRVFPYLVSTPLVMCGESSVITLGLDRPLSGDKSAKREIVP